MPNMSECANLPSMHTSWTLLMIDISFHKIG
jgi:hypothetical protein